MLVLISHLFVTIDASAEIRQDHVESIEGAIIKTAHGVPLKLAAIHILDVKAFEQYAKRWVGQEIAYEVVHRDRYGDALVIAHIDDEKLQAAIIRQGLALAYDTRSSGQLSELLAMEDALTLLSRTHQADEAEACVGTWCVVSGKIHEVAVKGKKAYLNFADDWKRDFTIYIEGAVLSQIGEDTLLELKGKDVTVRGHVDWYYGPRIVLHAKEMMDYAR
ncbi:MAG: hypothetical protein MRY32_02840 [Rickettsiales bacterium]|nr:hypothetical protein [Rickettsiales bacterium]